MFRYHNIDINTILILSFPLLSCMSNIVICEPAAPLRHISYFMTSYKTESFHYEETTVRRFKDQVYMLLKTPSFTCQGCETLPFQHTVGSWGLQSWSFPTASLLSNTNKGNIKLKITYIWTQSRLIFMSPFHYAASSHITRKKRIAM